MLTISPLHRAAIAILWSLLPLGPTHLQAQPSRESTLQLGANDLAGIVTSANGPEAGVWVIAETTDLPTRSPRSWSPMSGRYVVPDLPKANYTVWVRGYGLVDSPKGASEARQRSSICGPWSRRTRPRRRNTTRPSTGIRC